VSFSLRWLKSTAREDLTCTN